MAAEEEEYESHFVENPFIRIRERTQQRNLDGKTRLGAKQLIAGAKASADDDQFMAEEDAEKEDIVLVKESGKFIINDLELALKSNKLTGKRGRVQIAKDHEESDAGSSVGDNASD
jgi:hypothetical protein